MLIQRARDRFRLRSNQKIPIFHRLGLSATGQSGVGTIEGFLYVKQYMWLEYQTANASYQVVQYKVRSAPTYLAHVYPRPHSNAIAVWLVRQPYCSVATLRTRMLATLAHSSLQELSTDIRFPGLGAEDKKAKRMKADEGTGLAIDGNVSPQLTLY